MAKKNGKKETIAEQRKRERARRQQKWEEAKLEREAAEERAKEEQARIAEEQDDREWIKRAQKLRLASEGNKQVNPALQKKKSMAKAVGLKSALILRNDTLLMTGFGRGNSAELEKKIHSDKTGKTVEKIADPGKLTVTPVADKPLYQIAGRKMETLLYDPLLTEADRMDQIGCRKELEQKYFGRNFEDNIHIQIIYNILDMEKLLAVHVNNMVFSIFNVLLDGNEDYDLIGSIGLQNTFKEFKESNKVLAEKRDAFNKLLKSNRLGYFGSAFCQTENSCKKDQKSFQKKSDEDIYYTICLLGALRQATVHANQSFNSPYRLEERFDEETNKEIRAAVRDLLNRTYSARVRSLNSNFMDHSKVDLYILYQALDAQGIEEKTRLTERYYQFIVRKDQKNMGFSLKKLREMILAGPAKNYSETKYDSVRHKLYKAFDFMAFTWYVEHPEEQDGIVEALQSTIKPEEKDQIYALAAKKLWKAIGTTFEQRIAPEMDGEKIAHIRGHETLPITLSKDCMISETAHLFTELMYLLTLFLDGKEINILLTGLINKLERIQSFLDVLPQSGLEQCAFTDNYAMFCESGRIAEELRAVLSFSRMEKPTPAARQQLFVDAVKVLGMTEEQETPEEYWERFLSKEKVETVFVDGKARKQHGPRNFVASNIIGSDRFRYLMRYFSPEKARKIAENRPLVRFALQNLPDEQIVRYVNGLESSHLTRYQDGMRQKLEERIVNLSFDEFKEIRQYDKQGRSKAEQNKALIGLYLTVIYLIAKNLIYVNTRYFLAFYCWERDATLMAQWDGFPKMGKPYPYVDFASQWLKHRACEEEKKWNDKKKRNEEKGIFDKEFCVDKDRAQKYLKQNLQNADQAAILAFRNNTEHLTAIRKVDHYGEDLKRVDSWFALYHYLMQRTIAERNGEYANSAKYFADIETNKVYNKDFVKALCIPFCYNLARYKALCIDALFDKNGTVENDTEPKKPDNGEALPKAVVPEGALYFHTTKPELVSEKVTPTRKTTFYYKNRRYCGSLIRLSTSSEAMSNKKGIRPKVFALDIAKMPQECPFYTDDDGAWYVKEIPTDALSPCPAMAAT